VVPLSDVAALKGALREITTPFWVIRKNGQLALGRGGQPGNSGDPIVGLIPAVSPISLGDGHFRSDHGLKYAYVSGGMATGIGSVDIVEAMARAGMLGIYGAAGVPMERVEQAVHEVQQRVGHLPYGFNFIHSPNELGREKAIADLYLSRGVHLAESSAFLDLTYEIVRYRTAGIHQAADGQIVTPNRLIAKVSRVEVATRFFSPPPEKFLSSLVQKGELTQQQAQLAAKIPMAEDVTAEADSGGHTDNRPLVALLPTLLSLRDRMQEVHQYAKPLRVGAAGGIATPLGTAGAFALGASYVMTGSIHQACLEAGTSSAVKQMLAEADQADCTMCPAADMFELGVKVQVLKRGTMFAMRASKLYELYRSYPSMEALPDRERQTLEQTVFRMPLQQVWQQTREFFQRRDPAQIERAERDPKHQMALVFRWYLGQSSRWATSGDPERRLDYQVWSGPAMGAFNEWTRGTFLADPQARKVGTVARNLLYGAAYFQRLQILQLHAGSLPATIRAVVPQTDDELQAVYAF